ncbi:MAG TPA: hypothetical protein VME43_04880 [Bryobacteraceae bacterium]|nr:hypothetical protein [Bryobacteraceae bacterium]
MQPTARFAFAILLVACAAIFVAAPGPLFANDIIFLGGRVRLAGGAVPGHSVEIQLACQGADHAVRQVMTNKKGSFYLKVERDEFNHVARALPTTTMDVQNNTGAGNCKVVAALPGYTSSSIDLATFTIGKDLKLPDLVLTPEHAAH